MAPATTQKSLSSPNLLSGESMSDETIEEVPPPPAASATAKGGGARKGGKKTKAPPAPPKEKRALRYRATCPAKLFERLERAETQRLFLVERNQTSETSCDMAVLGSTGNVYNVHIGEIPTCSCPDFSRKQDLCKHIMFVTLKVIGLDKTDPRSYQRAYLPSELLDMMQLMQNRRVGGGTLANELVRKNYAEIKAGGTPGEAPNADDLYAPRRPLEEDSDCPICFDSLGGGSGFGGSGSEQQLLTYCRGTCGTNFHAACIRAWKTRGSAGTCPNCRQPWVEEHDAATPANANKEGYVNLGRLQGQSPARDTSTYRSRWNKRSRYY